MKFFYVTTARATARRLQRAPHSNIGKASVPRLLFSTFKIAEAPTSGASGPSVPIPLT